MQITSLLTKFRSGKAIIPTRFLAIEITAETVKTAVWQVDEGKTHVVTMGEMKEWDGGSESLVTGVDESLSTALEGIEPEPSQAVLGLPDVWVNGVAINEEAKKLLKSLGEKLELKFIGFVVTCEAVVHEIRRQEGVPLTAIVLTTTETEVIVQVVHLGKTLGSELVGRSEDIGADVEEGLARMKFSEPLPARMIITDGHLDLEGIRQNLLSYDWKGRLNFLHVPKIDILDREFSIRAVAQAGGTEAAKSLGLEVEELDSSQEQRVDREERLDLAAGFALETDVSQVEEKILEEDSQPIEQEESAKETVMIRESIKEKLTKWREKMPKWPRGWVGWRWGWVTGLGIIVGVTAVVLGLMAAQWTLVKANVVIYVKPQTLEQEISLRIDPSAQTVDVNSGVIPGRSIETEVGGGSEMEVSGEALVGDRAKGTVVIYNKTSAGKTFAKGTGLVGPKDLKFTIDEEVSVASSSSTTEGITFGKAEVAVTAAQIGTESNMDANSEFTVANFAASSYSAKNNGGFTGGSAKTARVVAKSDQQELTQQVKEKLINEAKDKAKGELSNEEMLLEGVVKEEVIKQQFSKAVGEETEKVSLVMQLKLTMVSVKQKDLVTVLLMKAQEKIPDSFQLEPEKTSLEIKSIAAEASGVTFLAQAKLVLVPQLNIEEIKQEIKGRYPEVVEDYFSNLPNYQRVKIMLTPKLPKRLAVFPRKVDNITVEVKVGE